MSAYDDLERQLRRRVRELDPAPGRRRALRGRRLAVVVAVPLALAGGTAAATAIVGGGPDLQERAERLAIRGVDLAGHAAPCTLATQRVPAAGLRLVDAPAPAAILSVVPALAPDAPGRLTDASIADALPSGYPVGQVSRSSVRVATLPDGSRLVVFVSFGSEFAPRDPAGCTRVRKERLLADLRDKGKPTDDPVTERALFLLDHKRDTDPRSPSLEVVDRPPGPNAGSGGTSVPFEPGRVVKPGLLLTGGTRVEKRFVGLAAPGATSVVVRAAPGSPRARSTSAARVVARDAPVKLGLFAFSEPGRGAGHLVIEHRGKDGQVLLRRRLQ
jgi:hypothetical protein